ncbi:hypothetical protein [Streptomyces venezuelae]|uniref:hypothetical protein n=1 Tax=Streptomyces venezuelae TaxID=54571 RepID=UPI0012397B72|nr:hypothetical protein [Streptomyces venezuelae]
MGNRVRAGARAAGGRLRRTAVCAVAVGAAVGGLVSCGMDREVTYAGGTLEELVPEDEKRGRELATEAMTLFRDAESVRVGVEMNTPKGHQKVSLLMDRNSNCTGTFDAGPAQRGDIIMVAGGSTYVRFSDAALAEIRRMATARSPETAARVRERTALASGKYLKIPTGPGGGAKRVMPVNTCDLDKFTSAMPGSPGPDDVIKALPETRRHGTAVIPLVENEDENEAAGDRTSVYVAAKGKPYLLGADVEQNGQIMKMRMSEYGEPVSAVAPTAAETIDLSKFGPGGGGLFEV